MSKPVQNPTRLGLNLLICAVISTAWTMLFIVASGSLSR